MHGRRVSLGLYTASVIKLILKKEKKKQSIFCKFVYVIAKETMTNKTSKIQLLQPITFWGPSGLIF